MNPPYLGAAYYPEDWDEGEIASDVARMREIGLTLVRIGEFAWRRMEPKPGQYDFAFFHRVIDQLARAGIAVILGTPTATPPAWLTAAHPDMFVEHENGRRAQHGGRRDCCSNHPGYVDACLRIVERMAQEFAHEPNIIGWQIDNEIYSWGMGCLCENCLAAFRQSLRERFGSVDRLNEAWNLNLFSQWYDDFDQVQAPRDAWQNPHLTLAWKDFQSESHIAFVRKQAEVLRRYVSVPLGTDTMPYGGMDYRRMTRALDIVQFNHYNDAENLWQAAFWFSHLRTLKPRPFWNTETATCWNGSAQLEQTIKPDGFCEANSWLPIALGGEANLYWLWRTHWAGHELMHGAVLSACGRPMHMLGEVRAVARGYRKAADFINATTVATDCALHFSSHCCNMHGSQPIVAGMRYTDTLLDSFYRPLIDAGCCPDVIDAAQPLEGYRLLLSPLMLTLEEDGLPQRIAQWVRGGGTWIVGPLTDVRDFEGARYRDRPFGLLEELTGARWAYSVPDAQRSIACAWSGDGAPFAGGGWYELFEPDGAEPLATVTQGYSTLIGKAAALRCRVGKGTVIVLGTTPSRGDLLRILGLTGVSRAQIEGSLVVAPRRGDGIEGLIAVETAGKPAVLRLSEPMDSLLYGAAVQGSVAIRPYQTLVLRARRA